MIVVSDTSPLSNLALVAHLWLLKQIYETLLIPDVVAKELAAARNPTISAIPQLDWIQIQSFSNTPLTEHLQQNRGLDCGEAHASTIQSCSLPTSNEPIKLAIGLVTDIRRTRTSDYP